MRNEYALPTSLLFFLPFSTRIFLFFLFFVLSFAENFASGCIKSTTWPALRPSFLVSGEKKNESLKKSKNGRPSRVVRPENRISSLLPENRF